MRILDWKGIGVGIGALLLAATASAADGVIEINQAAALAGISPNDPPGFPVLLTSGGSYVLTGDLVVDDVAISAISGFGVRDITLDLNGHTVSGPVSCPGNVPVCDLAGAGRGISLSDRAVVRNGTVRGFGDICVAVGASSVVEDLLIQACGVAGVITPAVSIIRRNRISNTGGVGISVSFRGALITDNTIFRNAGFGILMAPLSNPSLLNNSGFGGNVLELNNGGFGPQTAGGLEIAENICNSDTSCIETGCFPGTLEQRLSRTMSGCAGTVTWDERDSLCAPGWSVCTALEWVERRVGQMPTRSYWTDDDLRWTGATGNCFVHETEGVACPVDRPMRVCPSTSDPLGNTCGFVECGYHTESPNEWFGGCNSNPTAGTLCCL